MYLDAHYLILSNINYLYIPKTMERGEMSRIMARWKGPDIADGSQDALVLSIGQLLLAFLLVLGVFGTAILVCGLEVIWHKVNGGNSK